LVLNSENCKHLIFGIILLDFVSFISLKLK
jgi:hypothetical protein